MTDMSVKMSAKCVVARRDIYIRALNLPTTQGASRLRKLPPKGSPLFQGKFSGNIHDAGTLIRDMSDSISHLQSREIGTKTPKRKASFQEPEYSPKRYRSLVDNTKDNYVKSTQGNKTTPPSKPKKKKSGKKNAGFSRAKPGNKKGGGQG